MIAKDLSAYAQREWSDLMLPVTQLSKRGGKDGKPLVRHEKRLYNFDDICTTLFSAQRGKKPASADALDFFPKSVQLVEFKSGFRPKISKENFDQEKGSCKEKGGVCEEYWKLFSKLQKAQRRGLYDSIRAKAVESFLTLEKQVLPHCADLDEPIQVLYVVVIDVDPMESMQDILTDLATPQLAKRSDNILTDIKNALKKLTNITDVHGNIYCYDGVQVLSPREYTDLLSRHT